MPLPSFARLPARACDAAFGLVRGLARGLVIALSCVMPALPQIAVAAERLSAGFERTSAPDGDEPAIDIAVWYPTEAAAVATDLGPFTLEIAQRAPIAGKGLPLVLISHGNGGSSFSHHDTAIALAQAGYVVAAVTHTGDNHADQSREASMMDRPRHITRAIDHLLTNWRGHAQIDPARIGMFGFSSGGFTTLVIAGGIADLARVAPLCREHRSHYACQVIARRPESALAAAAAGPKSARDARVKAVVVAAPALGFTFTKESLATATLPIQLWRAEADDVLPHPFYAEAVRAALPQPPEYREVPNAGHFDFLAPCTRRFASMAPPLCRSADGFDRVAFHRELNASVVGFFDRTLKR